MRLKILLATEVLTDEAVEKVAADGLHGSFTLLPRHTDVLAALVPGLVSYLLPGGEERFAAVDGGLMVKRGALVTVSTPRGVLGDDPDRLHVLVEEEFRAVDERTRQARSAVARLEADFIRRLMELEDRVGAR